jgi:hypothetical protein
MERRVREQNHERCGYPKDLKALVLANADSSGCPLGHYGLESPFSSAICVDFKKLTLCKFFNWLESRRAVQAFSQPSMAGVNSAWSHEVQSLPSAGNSHPQSGISPHRTNTFLEAGSRRETMAMKYHSGNEAYRGRERISMLVDAPRMTATMMFW